jgi:DNA-binding NarL/FixJ family response regulator
MAIRVVLQERQRLLREGLSLFLEAQPDIEVVACVATADALMGVCATEAFDTVVLEIDVDEWDACKYIGLLRRARRRTRLIGTSTRPNRALAWRAATAGMQTVVPRTAGILPLVDAVRARSGDAVPFEDAAPRRPTSSGPLTARELDVLSAVASGSTARETSVRLGISPKTVENHKRRIFAKLDVQNQAHAVSVAMRGGILPPEAAFTGSPN